VKLNFCWTVRVLTLCINRRPDAELALTSPTRGIRLLRNDALITMSRTCGHRSDNRKPAKWYTMAIRAAGRQHPLPRRCDRGDANARVPIDTFLAQYYSMNAYRLAVAL
jgi:hypothetical protein